MDPDDTNLGEQAETAARKIFEPYWVEVLSDDFEPWKREEVERCFKLAFFEGAIYGAATAYSEMDEEEE